MFDFIGGICSFAESAGDILGYNSESFQSSSGSSGMLFSGSSALSSDLRCSVCGRSICGTYYSTDKGPVCEQDYINGCPCCESCGRRIVKGSYSVFLENRIACSDCVNSGAPKCFICNLPIVCDTPRYPENVYLCRFHNSNLICTESHVKVCYKRALEYIERYAGAEFVPHPAQIKLHSVSVSEMAELAGGGPKGLTVGDGYKFDIYVLKWLTPEYADSVMVHECGHVWQNMNNKNVSECTSMHKEGLCEWLSYKVNLGLNRKFQTEQLLKNQELAYSEGLKMYLKLEEKRGICGVRQYALSPQK